MKKTLGSILILAVVVAVAVFVIRLNNQEVSEVEVLETQSANVSRSLVSNKSNSANGDVVSVIKNDISNHGNRGLGCNRSVSGAWGANGNCFVVFSNCSVMDGVRPLTSNDFNHCDNASSGNSEAFQSCLESQCLGHDIDIQNTISVDVNRKLSSGVNNTGIEIVVTEDSLDNACLYAINGGNSATGQNCSVTYPDCTTIEGVTVITDNDLINCDGPDYMSCLENICLPPTGTGIEDILPSDEGIKISLTLNPGTIHPLVLSVERYLAEKGFFTLTPDQVFGYKTLDAIKAFQTANRLPVTGSLDSKTINLLIK